MKHAHSSCLDWKNMKTLKRLTSPFAVFQFELLLPMPARRPFLPHILCASLAFLCLLSSCDASNGERLVKVIAITRHGDRSFFHVAPPPLIHRSPITAYPNGHKWEALGELTGEVQSIPSTGCWSLGLVSTALCGVPAAREVDDEGCFPAIHMIWFELAALSQPEIQLVRSVREIYWQTSYPDKCTGFPSWYLVHDSPVLIVIAGLFPPGTGDTRARGNPATKGESVLLSDQMGISLTRRRPCSSTFHYECPYLRWIKVVRLPSLLWGRSLINVELTDTLLLGYKLCESRLGELHAAYRRRLAAEEACVSVAHD